MKINNYCLKFKKFKYVFLLVFLLPVSIGLTACNEDDEGPGISLNGPIISVSDFTGNWIATNAAFRSNSSPVQRVDVIDEGGSVTFVAQADGRFTISVNIPNRTADIFSGKLGFNEEEYASRLIVIFDGDAPDNYELFTIELINSDSELLLSGPTTFDFDDNGSEEPASVDLRLIRN